MKKNTEKDTDNIFWDKITNATNFIDLIVNKLKIQSLILNNAEDIPWYTYFRTQIAKKVKKFSKSSLITLDGKKYKDKFENEEEFDEFFKQYCSKDVWLNYDSSEESLAKYMAEHYEGISIHQKYIWVDIYSQESFDNWFNFVSEYVKYREEHVKYKGNKDTACFLISCHRHFDYKSNTNLESYSFRDSIDFYDCFIFFNLILSNFKILSDYYLSDYDLKDNIEEAEKDIRIYIAEFASNIIKDNINGKNIELFADYLSEKSYKNFINNPFNYIKNKNITINSEIENVLLKSQLRIIFPILEEFRQKVVSNYSDLIEEFKKDLNKIRESNNKLSDLIEDIMDCELKDFRELLSICNGKSNKIEDYKYTEIVQLEKKINLIIGEVYKKYNMDFEQIFEKFKRIIRDNYSNLIGECIIKLNEERKNKPYKTIIKDIMDLKLEDFKKIKKYINNKQLNDKINLFVQMNDKEDNKGYTFTLIDYYVNIRNILAHGNRDELFSFTDVKNIIYFVRVIPVEVIMYYVEKYSICKKLGLL